MADFMDEDDDLDATYL